MKQRLLSLVISILFLFVALCDTWAGKSTYYSECVVKSSPTAGGKVYVSTSNSGTPNPTNTEDNATNNKEAESVY